VAECLSTNRCARKVGVQGKQTKELARADGLARDSGRYVAVAGNRARANRVEEAAVNTSFLVSGLTRSADRALRAAFGSLSRSARLWFLVPHSLATTTMLYVLRVDG